MKLNPPRVPRGLIIAIVVLLVLGLIASSLVDRIFTEQQLANNVLLAAIPFILIFVAIVLTFITLIVIAATMLNNNIPPRPYSVIERILMAGIVLGIVGMFQPWIFWAYKYGFIVLLFSTLGYILWSHVVPYRPEMREELENHQFSG
ncbi:MAG: hypothetical protein D6770_07685 [Anaerolineae bacterium]|nr:MAG: hypothetical protein D6770_07685 [Anaerolineae bacterium]